MSELAADPAFQRRENEKQQILLQREREYAQQLNPIMMQLWEHGLQGATLQDIVRNHAPLPMHVVDILLAGLVGLRDSRVQETVVRALGAAEHPYDGEPVVKCFDSTTDEGLRWAVLNTVAISKPHSIDDWLTTIAGTPDGATLRDLTVR